MIIDELKTRLVALLDEDPRAAIQEARALDPLAFEPAYGPAIALLRAAILVDGGSDAGDPAAVEEGIEGLEQLQRLAPDDALLGYNIANGYDYLSRFDRAKDANWVEWMQRTLESRCRVRAGFHEAGAGAGLPRALRTQALTNLGNSLSRAYRWVEAYDAYRAALEIDPSNGMASGNAALMLQTCHKRGLANKHTLPLAAWYLTHAALNADRVRAYGGESALAAFKAAMAYQPLPPQGPADLSHCMGYERFVAGNRLALVPVIEGLDLREPRWDSLVVGRFTEPFSTGGAEPPAIFAMFNTAKQNFLAIRYIAYEATQDPPPETGRYTDTLDYALYGVAPGLVAAAFKGAVDVLDQVACIVNELLGKPVRPTKVQFRTFWLTEDARWRDYIAAATMDESSCAYGALADLATDLRPDGRYAPQGQRRHAATHRFVVVHDEMLDPGRWRENPAVEHLSYQAFQDDLILMLQAARASLMYLAELVGRRDSAQTHEDLASVPFLLPEHHWVRHGCDGAD